MRWFYNQFESATRDDEDKFNLTSDESSVVIGMFGNQFCNTTIRALLPLVDFE